MAVMLLFWLYGLTGFLVVNAQISFFWDAIGHSFMTEIAIGSLSGLGDPLCAMMIFSIVISQAIVWVRKMAAASTDTIIALFMAFAMVCGVVVLSRGGGFNKYIRYLIDDALEICRQDLWGSVNLGFGGHGRFLCELQPDHPDGLQSLLDKKPVG